MKTCLFVSADCIMSLMRRFLFLLYFPGRSQWGGTHFFPGRLSLEGASFFFGEGAQRGDTHQVCPLYWPEWTVEDPVCPCWAQHLPEQVWYWLFLLFLHIYTQYVFTVNFLKKKTKQNWVVDVLFFFGSPRNWKDVNTVNTSADSAAIAAPLTQSLSVNCSLPTDPPNLLCVNELLFTAA